MKSKESTSLIIQFDNKKCLIIGNHKEAGRQCYLLPSSLDLSQNVTPITDLTKYNTARNCFFGDGSKITFLSNPYNLNPCDITRQQPVIPPKDLLEWFCSYLIDYVNKWFNYEEIKFVESITNFYYQQFNSISSFQEQIKRQFKIDVGTYVPPRVLSLELGTGYYAIQLIEQVEGSHYNNIDYFNFDKGKLAKLKNLQQKYESSIRIKPTFDIYRVPDLIFKKDFDTIVANTGVGKEQDDEKLIQYYKKHLYNDANPLVDENSLCSSIMVTDGQYTFDLLHIYLILFTHLRIGLQSILGEDELKNKKSFQQIKYSLPVKASISHSRFMDCAISALFPDYEILQVTEPEAAFAHLASSNQLSNVDTPLPSNQHENVIIIDGGDGTIDCLRLQRSFSDKQTSIWTYPQISDRETQLQRENKSFYRYDIGGSKYYLTFQSKIKSLFPLWFKNEEILMEQWTNEMFTEYRDKGTISLKSMKSFQKLQCDKSDFEKIIISKFSNLDIMKNDRQLSTDEFKQLLEQNDNFKQVLQTLLIKPNSKILQEVDGVFTEIVNKLIQTDAQKNPVAFLKDQIEDLVRDSQQHIVIHFVGGLSKQKKFTQPLIDFIHSKSPIIQVKEYQDAQVIISRGIPFDSQKITPRNLNAIAPFELFGLRQVTLRGDQIDAMKQIKGVQLLQHNKYDRIQKHQCGKTLYSVPTKLIEMNKKLHWQEQKLCIEQRIDLDTTYPVYFLKTDKISQKPLPFVRMDDASIKILENYFDVCKYEFEVTSQDLQENNIYFQFKPVQYQIRICVNFDVRQFVTQPIAEICVMDGSGQYKVVKSLAGLWNWYEMPCQKAQIQWRFEK